MKVVNLYETRHNVINDAIQQAQKRLLAQGDLLAKSSDQSISSSTTHTADTVLFFPVLASTKYHFRAVLSVKSGASGGFKYYFTGPGSPTLVSIKGSSIGAVAAFATSYVAAFSTDLYTVTNETQAIHEAVGFISNGTNAGSVALSWAQNASNGTATIVQQGSFLEWRQL